MDADLQDILEEKNIKKEVEKFEEERPFINVGQFDGALSVKCETESSSSTECPSDIKDDVQDYGFESTQECEEGSLQKETLDLPVDSRSQLYLCNVCNKSFSRKSHLDSHLRTHYGEKPYTCDVCSKAFSWKCDLVKHLRLHSGEKPFQCGSCEKSFSRKDHLVSHSHIHSRTKEFDCKVCGKLFSRKDHLMSHNRVHSGEKPYCCQVCNKLFSHRSHMVKHSRDHY